MSGRVRIGISGWSYKPWRGVFYPEDLAQKRELAYAATQFPAIEINGTFYGPQRPATFSRWRDETPDDFVFAVKGPRSITHQLRLRDIDRPLADFIASGLLRLGSKLGPILWQFPPGMAFDAELFGAFLAKLPHSAEEAEAFVRHHGNGADVRVHGDDDRPVRHAVEIRHDSFRDLAFIGLLRKHDVALVCADTVKWPLLMDLTSDFVYCRLHGSEQLYVSGYDDRALDRWATRVRSWALGREPCDAERVCEPTAPREGGRDVFVFFDNSVKGRSPRDAKALIRRLEG